MTEAIYDLSKRMGQYRWLLDEVLSGIPLRQIAGAFGTRAATIMRLKKNVEVGTRPSDRNARLMQRGIKLMQDLCSENGLELSQWTELKFTKEEVQGWLLQQIAFPIRRPPASGAAEMHRALQKGESADKLMAEVVEKCDGHFIEELEPHEQADIFLKILSAKDADLFFQVDLILAALWVIINASQDLPKAIFVQKTTTVALMLESLRDLLDGSAPSGLQDALGLTKTWDEEFVEKTIRYSRKEGSPVFRVRVRRERPSR